MSGFGTSLPSVDRILTSAMRDKRTRRGQRRSDAIDHKTSTGDVCSHVGDWVANGHVADSAIRQRLTHIDRLP